MNVFVAGASGAIGRPLVAELVRRGHTVTGMTRSDAGATALADLGAAVARVSAFDAAGLEQALRESKAEVVIDELTSLPKSPADMAAAAEGDRRLRLEGGGNLLAAARRCGVRRYVQQASGFFLRPGPGLGGRVRGAGGGRQPAGGGERPHLRRAGGPAAGRRGHRGRRPAVRVLLRAGHLVPPGRGVRRPGAAGRGPGHRRRRGRVVVGPHRRRGRRHRRRADRPARGVPRRRRRPVPGVGLAAGVRPGGRCPAPAPDHGEQALAAAGEDAVYYGTKLRGASNAKAKRVFGFRPRGWSG